MLSLLSQLRDTKTRMHSAPLMAALKVADDVVILNGGCVVYNGTVEDIQNRRDILVANLGIF